LQTFEGQSWEAGSHVSSSKNKNAIFSSELSHNWSKFTKIQVFIFYFSTQNSTPETFFTKNIHVVEDHAEISEPTRVPMKS